MMDNNDEQALTKALSFLSVQKCRQEDDASTSISLNSSQPLQRTTSVEGSSIEQKPTMNENGGAFYANNQGSGIDLVLVEAMRSNRDKIFVCKYEKEMEEMIQNESVHELELPLMNTYQRLLVHRIADHFNLAHSIDQNTKLVTLSKKEDTKIPEICISTLAERERISDPVPFPPLLSSLSGQSTPSSNTGTTVSGTPSVLRIMRREAANVSSRSDSPRNGTNTPDDNGSSRKDRKNMTMEEREAAYREARQRIFGNNGSSDSNVDCSEQSNRKESTKSNSSRSTTPFSGTLDANIAGPSTRQASLTEEYQNSSITEESSQSSTQLFYDPHSGLMRMPSSGSVQGSGPTVDPNYGQTTYYGYPPYGPGWQPVPQTDVYGRPLMNQPWNYNQQQYLSDLHSSNAPSAYGDQSYSSGVSSRSTSMSASVDGIESTRSSLSDQFASQSVGNQTNNAALITNPALLQQNRSQSVSPTVSLNHRSPPSTGNHTPGGSFIYPPNVISPPIQNNQWSSGYIQNGSMNGYTLPPSPMEYGRNGMASGNNGALRSPLGFSGNVSSPSSLLHNSAYAQTPMHGNGTPPSALSPGTYFNGASTSQQLPPAGIRADESFYQVPGRGRGRVSQGSERGLYDPNKPNQSTGSHRHGIGKSSSAAAVLEYGQGQPRRDGLLGSQASNSPTSSRAVTPSGESIRRSSSSNMRNGTTTPSSGFSTSTASSLMNHPSLPARPDWVIAEKQTSLSSLNSTRSNGNTQKANGLEGVGTPELSDLSHISAASMTESTIEPDQTEKAAKDDS